MALAQTRHQQWEASEKARLPAGEYEKNAQKQEEVRKDALAALKKEERRYDMEKFYSYVSLIRSKIKSIDEGNDDLWRISSQSMVSVSDEEVADLSARLELISARTNKNAEEIRGLLKEISVQNSDLSRDHKSGASACMRMRKVQEDALVRKFTQSIGSFESTENSIQAKSRELLVRRFQIVEPDLRADEVISSLTSEDPSALGGITNVFAFAGGAGNSAELERKLDHLRAQQRSMQRLEKNILSLNKMFLDMQNLVLSQEDNLNRIEVYVQKTVEFQKATDVERAIEYQKNIRKIRCSVL